VATRRFEFDFAGEHAAATLAYLHDGALALTVGNVSGALSFSREGDRLDVHFAGERFTCAVYTRGETDHVFADRGAAAIVSLDLLAHSGEGAVEGGRLTAPMPGKVVSFAVKPGDKVGKGQPLAVMEAMKMEHTIAAPADGTVQELLYAPGDQVDEGAELLKLAA
jgi:3-methylcrotonyl-CoA carboxylase alpha subunit